MFVFSKLIQPFDLHILIWNLIVFLSYVICTIKIGQLIQQPIILWGAQKLKLGKAYLKIVNKLLDVQFGCSHIITQRRLWFLQMNL